MKGLSSFIIPCSLFLGVASVAQAQVTRILSLDRLTYADVRLEDGKLSYSAGIRQVVKKDTLDNFDYWKDAILTEMFNHEYGINWQADYDVLSAFGNPEWRRGDKNTLEAWFKDVGFNAKQKKAYASAKEEYYKICTEKGIL